MGVHRTVVIHNTKEAHEAFGIKNVPKDFPKHTPNLVKDAKISFKNRNEKTHSLKQSSENFNGQARKPQAQRQFQTQFQNKRPKDRKNKKHGGTNTHNQRKSQLTRQNEKKLELQNHPYQQRNLQSKKTVTTHTTTQNQRRKPPGNKRKGKLNTGNERKSLQQVIDEELDGIELTKEEVAEFRKIQEKLKSGTDSPVIRINPTKNKRPAKQRFNNKQNKNSIKNPFLHENNNENTFNGNKNQQKAKNNREGRKK